MTVSNDPPHAVARVASACAAGVLAVAFAFTPSALPGVPLCGFRATTGLPCSGCGLTRAFCAIAHGQFAQAWAFNPFGYVFFAITMVCLASPVLVRMHPDLATRALQSRAALYAPILLVAAMVLFGIARLICLMMR